MKTTILVLTATVLLTGCAATTGQQAHKRIVYSTDLPTISLEEKASRTNKEKSFEKDMDEAKFLKIGDKCYEMKYLRDNIGSEVDNKIDFIKKQRGITKRQDFINTLEYKKMNGNIVVVSRGNDLSTHNDLNDCYAFNDNTESYKQALVDDYQEKLEKSANYDCINRMETGQKVSIACQQMYDKLVEGNQEAAKTTNNANRKIK